MSLGFIALGTLPSLIWLSIYLREDEHPEPNRFILKTFFLGALFAPIAAGIEFLSISLVRNLDLPEIAANFLTLFVFIGIVEEYCKFLAVRLGMLKNRAFDEPTDAMIYLIIAGLGFAALENVLAIFHFAGAGNGAVGSAFEITALRFLSSTLLHVLASAIVGYYLARSHFFLEKRAIIKGLVIAGLAHGAYNGLTLASDSFQKIGPTILVIALLATMAIAVNMLFYKLKRDFFR
ncbi:MAG: PrsW family intramembrane metalloprotease [Parcubacteria group bacterium]|nr:PrsW family intramembrane metalloprotease [Parcubacteria group bacterium]